MKRMIAFLLYMVLAVSFVMMAGCQPTDNKKESTPTATPELLPMEPSVEVLLYSEDTEQLSNVRLQGNTYGIQFNATAPVEEIQVYVVDTNNLLGTPKMTVSVYAWTKNYANTIQSTPCVTQELTDMASKSWASVNCKQNNAPLPKGEYLVVIENGENGVKLAKSSVENGYVCTYMKEAAINGDLQVRVQLSEKGVLAQVSNNSNDYVVSSDTWVVTDGLNREVSVSYTDTKRDDRYVGIFFHTWHSTKLHVNNGFMNITQILEKYSDLEINNYSDSRWGKAPTYFWNEPLWGYYRTTDEWVLRRQAELLADAQIDVVFFDCTNGKETFLDDALALMRVWSEARTDGVKTPAVAFQLPMFNFDHTASQLRTLYEKLYSQGLYKDLWFYWKGKPLILAYPENLSTLDPTDVAIREFFQYRVISHTQSEDGVQVQSADGTPIVLGNNSTFIQKGYQLWNWISAYPQIVNYNPDGTPEQMAVSVSHNWSKETHLTAFSNQTDTVYSRDYIPTEDRYDTRENAKLYGAYFEAQWERALKIDPEFIFITGWNEWTASRFEEYWGVENAFIDNFTDNRSRDIEPSKGDLKDHYYYQMVSYIRKYKGTGAVPVQKTKNTIDLNATEDPWAAIDIKYESYAGDTFDRDCNGYKDAETGKYIHYQDTTGRNDFVYSKVAYDDKYVTFMVETANAVSAYTDPAWMRLLIEVVYANGKAVSKDNWESFQYIVNRSTPKDAQTTVLEASTGGWNWNAVGDVQYKVSGNRLQIQIPRAMLGIAEGDFTLNFKWSDNMQTDGDIMDFYTHGDVAPGGRYKYQFVAGSPVVQNKKSMLLPLGGGFLGGLSVVGLAIAAIFHFKKRKKNGESPALNQDENVVH